MVDYVSLSVSIVALVILLFHIWLEYFRRANVKCKIVHSRFTLPEDGWATLSVKAILWNPSRRTGIVRFASLAVIGMPPHDYQRGHGLHVVGEEGRMEDVFEVPAGAQVVVEGKVKIPWINLKCFVFYYLIDRTRKFRSPTERLWLEHIDHKHPLAGLIWESKENG